MNSMKKHLKRIGLATGLVALLALVLLGPSVALASAEAVYYQVTYEDGGVKDLAAVPTTKEGIRRVLRVVRHAPGYGAYEVLSTGEQPLTVVNAARVVRTELKWNGRAWIDPAARKTRPAPAKPEPADAAVRGLAHITRGLELRAAELAEAVEKARRQAEKLNEADRARAQVPISVARSDLAECRSLLAEYRARLAAAVQSEPADGGDRTTPDAESTSNANAAEIERAEAALARLRARLRFFTAAAVEAEGGLFEEAGTTEATDARWELEAVRKIRDELRRRVAAHEQRLAELKAR